MSFDGEFASAKGVIRGEIVLARPIEVAVSALGRKYEGSIGGRPVTIFLPRIEGERHELQAPSGAWEPRRRQDDEAPWGTVKSYSGIDSGPRSALVRSVAYRTVEASTESEIYLSARRFGEDWNAWWSQIDLWLAAWVPDFSSTDGATSGSAGTYRAVGDGRLSGWEDSMIGILRTELISDQNIRSAVELVSRNSYVPLAWALLITAERSQDYRRRVIEAATAVEVALDAYLDFALSEYSLTEGQVSALLGPMRNMNSKVRLAEELSRSDQNLQTAVAEYISGPRNRAVHRGEVPSQASSASALRTAREVLDRYSLLVG